MCVTEYEQRELMERGRGNYALVEVSYSTNPHQAVTSEGSRCMLRIHPFK